MTTHDGHTTPIDPMEARLRTMLAERATDVDATPALFQDVRDRARRGTLARRAVGGLVVAAALAGGALVLPGLLGERTIAPIAPIDETPETSAPSEVPTLGPAPTPSPPVADGPVVVDDAPVVFAYATTDAVFVGDREQLIEGATVRALGGHGVAQARVQTLPLVTQRPDGTTLVAVVDISSDGSGTNDAIPAAPNGDGVTMSPDGQAAAWIEGSMLHIWPLGSGEQGVRPLPIEGAAVPGNLVIEQWFIYADAPVILASVPGGGMWTIPMDESNVFNTGPVGDAFPSGLVSDVDDAVQLQDGSVLGLIVADGSGQPAAVRFGQGPLIALPAPYATSNDLELEAGAGGGVTVLDRADGTAGLLRFAGDDGEGRATSVEVVELGTGLTGAVTMGIDDQSDARAGQDGAAAQLGLRTDAPVIGTDGVELVLRAADGTISRREVYPAAESEAVLGQLAVRPGSTPQDGLVAIESFSEGETSVRFVALEGSSARPTGAILVAEGPLTGLVWSDDGRQVAWSDDAGLHVADVEGLGASTGASQLSSDVRPVVDWIWTDQETDRVAGHLTVRTGVAGVELLAIERTSTGTTLGDPLGGSERLLLDTHANPGAAVGPSVEAAQEGAVVRLSWSADGDQAGMLDVGPSRFDGPVRVDAHGGQVLVLAAGGTQVLVTFAGEVVELPSITDWAVLA